nr:low temperature requirement protein A [Micromonospora sp. DSM 115978]
MLPLAEGARVTRLELFFDLVFVFAFLNVTRLMADDLTQRGLIRGLLLLMLLWWCWCSFAWVGNLIRIDQGIMPVVLFIAVAAILVVALTAPETIVDKPGGISGPLVFPVCYLIVRSLHVGTLWYVHRGEPDLRRQLLRVGLPALAAVLLLTASALVSVIVGPPTPFPLRSTLWTLAIGIEYGSAAAVGAQGWRIVSAGHWAERHGLIIIVALGESILALGGSGELVQAPVSWSVIGVGLTGIAVTASLWWLYFDFIALASEQALHSAKGASRGRLARDAYTYLHLPMIAGIILFSLGTREVLEHVIHPPHGNPAAPLHVIDVSVLYGGVATFLLAHLGFQLRMLGTVLWSRAITIVLLGSLVPVVVGLPPLGVLGVLAAVCGGLVLVEHRTLAGSRRAVREAVLQEHVAHEARETAWRRRHR